MNDINDILSAVTEPLLGLNAQAMALQTQITDTEKKISLDIEAGFPTGPLALGYLPKLNFAIQTIRPDASIHISSRFFIKAHKTQLLGKALRGVKNTIAIASGKGGVGKSTVTVNLAAALAKAGAKVGILDADIYGPSIPLMLGAHDPVQIQDQHYLPVLAHGIQAMSIGYITDNNQALIWRGPMLAKSLIQLLDLTLWDSLDYLLIDLPPGTGDIQLSLVQKIPLTGAVVVTTPQTVATLDAQKAISMFKQTGIEVLGLIENMSTHICSQCQHVDPLFGEGGGKRLSEQFNVPLLGQLPLDATIQRDCDKGSPTALRLDHPLSESYMKTALTLAIEIAKKPLNYADKFPPIVVE